jgi:UDP-N-acetylmuramoyl-tripeptide--D-alanyl-D-alanine ligase
MPRNTQFGVFEMGMNHAGELTDLSSLVRPDIAIITKIAPAHLAHFNSVDDIARAKAEIFSGIAEGGRAIINLDDSYGSRLARTAKRHGAKVITVGAHERADIRIGDVQTQGNGSLFTLHVDGETHLINIPIAGEHWVINAALAIAAAHTAGVAVADAAESLTTLAAMPGRGERFETELNGAHIQVVDESYNANPESMRAAMTAVTTEGRKIAVLGSMLELGADELDLHAALSHPLVKSGFDRIITVGEPMRALKGALPQKLRAAWCADADAAWDALLGEVREGDTVLIKGSNGAKLGQLVTRLRERGTPPMGFRVIHREAG